MASTIKVNNIQNQCGANITNKCGTTITLGASGDTITLACGASQTGFGRTGTVDWDTTAKTASFTAVSGNGYFVNTTSGAITVTLPAGSAGDIVSLADYAATWQTNNVTVTPNGTDKIGGVNVSVTLNTEGQSVTFVYTDSTQGWINTMDSTSNVRGNAFIIATGGTVTTCGDYKIHTFTSPGTFCVSSTAACASDNNVDYLVVAGGGGSQDGGGGAGGFRISGGTASGCYTVSPLGSCVSALPVSATGYPITVGAGGSGVCNPAPAPLSTSGSNSVFSTITSAGGGRGGNAIPGPRDGGSGGGSASANQTGGTGNTPPVSPPQGNNGGTSSGCRATGSGGGGASAVGGDNSGPRNGGDGSYTGIFNSPTVGESGPVSGVRYFAGGGGAGGSAPDGYSPTTGGIGGGGNGFGNSQPSPTPAGSGQCGSVNTGGGGGGAWWGVNGKGGSGIVIIRYKFQ
jgi:hypothetical protein